VHTVGLCHGIRCNFIGLRLSDDGPSVNFETLLVGVPPIRVLREKKIIKNLTIVGIIKMSRETSEELKKRVKMASKIKVRGKTIFTHPGVTKLDNDTTFHTMENVNKKTFKKAKKISITGDLKNKIDTVYVDGKFSAVSSTKKKKKKKKKAK